MTELVLVPMKRGESAELSRALRSLLQAAASTADAPSDWASAAASLANLRTAALRISDPPQDLLPHLYNYCDQLNSLEEKISTQNITAFKWRDAFDKGRLFGGKTSLTLHSLSYEKFCVLFNIAALQSAIAVDKPTNDDDGLKSAAKLFQQSAGIFKHLKETVAMVIQESQPTSDITPDALAAFQHLMLAQAQEIILLKAINDNMKHPYIPFIANQCKELYSIALKAIQKENVKQILDKEWISIVSTKQIACEAVAFFYYSLHFKSQMSVGQEISSLQHCIELFKSAQTTRGKLSIFQEQFTKAQRNLNEVKKDNDLIYHDIVPDVEKLEPLGKIALANPLALPQKWSDKGSDLFESLVPVPVSQAMAAYEVRKNELVNAEINKLRESTQMLNSTLASLNLPASIEQTTGTELPQSIKDKADTLKESGGVEGLQSLMRDLPELLQRNNDILNESERMLREESEADNQLRAQFGERWTRTQSDKLNPMFISNASKYRLIIENAMTADGIVHEKFEKHREGMELLSKSLSELEANIPTSSSGGVRDSSSVMALRKLMEDVETIKAERDVIESELKSATQDMKSQFLGALSQDGAISEAGLSIAALGKSYGPLQKQVASSIERQDSLIKDIQNANEVFVAEKGGSGGGRETKLCQLAAAHDAYCDLLSNLKEGNKFYNDLTQLLVTFQNKISDFCFARKTEKEELLKDLTHESSRVGSVGPAPTPPQHHNVTPPEPRAGGTAPPTTTSASLPYPTAGHGNMPVPYGAPGHAPYPTYQPAPMPQGYNPYGVPYPSGGYQGFPQSPYAPHPLQYPQQSNPYQQPNQYPQGMPQYPPGAPQYPGGAPQYPGAQPQFPQYPPQPPQW
ncbi:programmed cell death 6-interacting protein-like protein AliX [Arctopsyche grandis]|uniref:programmed cell death 6-interacting protein-like protein AliX n=1 Tax=Arctopsyche grandis TaxID=121162 RepID=UPI00406D7E6E